MEAHLTLVPKGFHKSKFTTRDPHRGKVLYDETVHNATCIHMVQGKPCGNYTASTGADQRPNGWLCPQHDSQLNPKLKQGTISVTPEEIILMESERLRPMVAKLRQAKPRLEPKLWRAVEQAMEPDLLKALHPTVH